MKIPMFLIYVTDYDSRTAYDEGQVRRTVAGLKGSRYVDSSNIKVFQVLSDRDVTSEFIK